MKIMRWAAALAVAAMAVAVPSFVPTNDVVYAEGEDDAAKDPVRAAWAAYKPVVDEHDTKRAAIMEEYNKVAGNEDASKEDKVEATNKARAALSELGKEYRAKLGELRKTFTEEFEKVTEYTRYADNTEMLAFGLMNRGNTLRRDNPDEAMKFYELILKHCPKADEADTVRSYSIPEALEAKGDFEATLKRCNELLKETSEKYKPALLQRIGDYSAALGNLKAAVKAYEDGLALCEGELASGDPRNNAKRYLEIRNKLTGKDAPNVDSKVWLDGEAKSLAALKGNVVIIDFWATWCGPCRVAMPGLDKIYKENKDKGVNAIGLTRFYANGFLPNDSSNLSKGESVRGITEEGYLDHLKEFKKRSELSYPFVVGQKEDFEAYGVTGIPTMAIVNKEGKVAMLVVGSGNDALIEACVKNLIK
jgi:thiol-disulfide isomerase/thioredoxin